VAVARNPADRPDLYTTPQLICPLYAGAFIDANIVYAKGHKRTFDYLIASRAR